MSNDLEPLDPATARQMYFDERRHEVSDATIQSHGYRLKQFVQWCEQDGLDNWNDLSGRDVHRFRVKQRNEDELATLTMKGQLATLRVFLRFCSTDIALVVAKDEHVGIASYKILNAKMTSMLNHRGGEK